jgi:hypothetical protein
MRHLPLWIGSVLILSADLAWWWLVSGVVGRLAARHRAAAAEGSRRT